MPWQWNIIILQWNMQFSKIAMKTTGDKEIDDIQGSSTKSISKYIIEAEECCRLCVWGNAYWVLLKITFSLKKEPCLRNRML